MKPIPAPEILTQRIARRAVEIAQMIGPRRTGKGLNSLIPLYQPGIIGIEIPDETSYMFDLDKGIKEHAMVDLAGRVIPIRNPGGTISFRSATNKNIGVIPIISRSAKDGRILTNKPEWVYPGKAGLSFLQKSLTMSVNEWKRSAKAKDVIDILMKTDLKYDLDEIINAKPSIF
jgi:hypothetical protein